MRKLELSLASQVTEIAIRMTKTDNVNKLDRHSGRSVIGASVLNSPPLPSSPKYPDVITNALQLATLSTNYGNPATAQLASLANSWVPLVTARVHLPKACPGEIWL